MATVGLVAGCQSEPQPQVIGWVLIKAERILDVNAGTYLADHAVLVDHQRIVRTGPLSELQSSAPAGTKLLDLGSATVLPGLIDVHAHVMATMDARLETGTNIITAIRGGFRSRLELGIANAQELLDAGFTTVRNLGHSGVDGDVILRDQIEGGETAGPRLLASGRKITPPGGQAVARFEVSDEVLEQEFIPVRGTDQADQAVRDLVSIGVDVIKVVADDEDRRISREDMTTIVRAAHYEQRRVAVHATTAEGIQMAIDAGADTIEHGNEATDEMLVAMREKNITLVPMAFTLDAMRDLYLADPAMSESERAATEKNMSAFIEESAQLVQRATKAGVRIAAGSDMWLQYPGKTRGQASKIMLRALVHSGMTPAGAIRAATVEAADAIGAKGRVGSLASGNLADIIAVQGDPLADIAALDAVTFVMKNGVVLTGQR